MALKKWFIPFAIIVCGSLSGNRAVAAAAKPNVLFICVDDLKPLLGCYGDQRIRSPNIDRLAARGLLFERAYCNQAMCAPSRNALLTGVRPTTMDIYYESADVPDNAYPDGRIADEAIRRLQSAKAKKSEPFFLAVGFLKPHLPFCAPKKYWDLYDRASFAVPALRTPPEGAPS